MTLDNRQNGVAQNLADEQRQTSIAEFFEKNKQMLGFGSKNRAIVTAVKEGVDNSLDAAEEARIFPDITVEIENNREYYTVSIEDNGPGIPKSSVPSVFGKLLYGSRFHREMQQRGQQGIGISAAVLYSQLTSGNPARVKSKTEESDKAYYVEVGIDTDDNTPIIHSEREVEWSEKEHGIRIELDMEGNMRARKRLHTYIKNTAVVNPHARLELHEPDDSVIFDERAVNELPDEVEEIKPHPHGIELGTLLDIIKDTSANSLDEFLQQEFTRVGAKTSQGIIDSFLELQFGRSISWEYSRNMDRLQGVVESSINRKGRKVTEEFAERVTNRLKDLDSISYYNIESTVNEVSNYMDENSEKTFGSTVRSKCIENLWSEVSESKDESLNNLTSSVTVDRKSQDLIDKFSSQLSIAFSSRENDKFITKSELENIVLESAESAAEEKNGAFGEKARQKVVDKLWENYDQSEYKLPPLSQIGDDREIARRLLKSMKDSNAVAPPKKCISPITESHIIRGLKSRYNADFYSASTRSSSVANGKPFVVEAGVAYGGDISPDGKIELNRFANRVPLVYQEGACSITREVKSIRWNSYKLSQNSGSLPKGPMVLLVHIASTNVPFTSESKDAVASVPEMKKEIERAVREVGRDIKSHLKQERKRKERQVKRDTIGGLLSDMSEKLEQITGDKVGDIRSSQSKILNNLYIRKTGNKTVRVSNYTSAVQELKLTIETTDKTRNRTVQVQPSESNSVTVGEDVVSVSVDNIDDTKVTINN